jgi:hypothetical protein
VLLNVEDFRSGFSVSGVVGPGWCDQVDERMLSFYINKVMQSCEYKFQDDPLISTESQHNATCSSAA